MIRQDIPRPTAEQVLANWASLTDTLSTLTEEECLAFLNHELENGKRMQFAFRLHGRYNKLRYSRERLELIRRM